MSTLLEVRGLGKHFGGIVAIKDLNFEVKQGEILGLIGPNGAGKTTLFNLICGDYRPSTGIIKYKGEVITGLKPYEICKKGISRTYQLIKPFLNQTVLQNVLVGALFGRKGFDPKGTIEYAEKALRLVGLEDKRDVLVKGLNILERKKVEVARALATGPQLLLLDEPVAGLNPKEADELMEIIRQIYEMRVTIFMIEHVMRTVMMISDRIIVLHHGEKISEGIPAEVANDKKVIEAYLGA